MSRWLYSRVAGATIAIVWLVAPAGGLAQEAGAGAAVPGNGFGFHAALGYGSISGEYGELMTDGIPAEGGAWYQTGALRLGASILVASYAVVEPFESQSISQVSLAASAMWRFRTRDKLQPFVGVTAGAIRFRPEGALFDPDPPPPDVPPGENPAPERTGFMGGFVVGLEHWATRHFAISGSVGYRLFSTDPLDVPLIGVSGIETGGLFDVTLGVEWAI